MKYFLDTEFIEGFHKPLFGKRRHFIDLISIGIVCDDGWSYNAISSEWEYKDADKWVQDNVINPLYVSSVHGDERNRVRADNFHRNGYGIPNELVTLDLRARFEYDVQYSDSPIEIYGYFADYDWVLFCSLFGRMINLPKGMPMYCRDLKQMADEKIGASEIRSIGYEKAVERLKQKTGYPKQSNEHNALSDAKWNLQLYKWLQTF